MYLLEIFFILLIAFYEIKSMKVNGFIPNQSELTVKVFEGFNEYHYVKGGEGFQIPMKYLLFTLLAGIFVAYYPAREWKLRGTLCITRYQSKYIWWISKCIWSLIQTLCVYIVAYLGIAMVVLLMGESGFHIREGAMMFFCNQLI